MHALRFLRISHLITVYSQQHLVRSGLSTSSSRFENGAAQFEEQNKVFLIADKVESFKDIIEKLPELHR